MKSGRVAQKWRGSFVLVATVLACPFASDAASLDEQVRAIRAVAAEGSGHANAIAAVKELSRGDAATLLPILKAFDDANPLAANWLRGAFEAVAARELKQ